MKKSFLTVLLTFAFVLASVFSFSACGTPDPVGGGGGELVRDVGITTPAKEYEKSSNQAKAVFEKEKEFLPATTPTNLSSSGETVGVLSNSTNLTRELTTATESNSQQTAHESFIDLVKTNGTVMSAESIQSTVYQSRMAAQHYLSLGVSDYIADILVNGYNSTIYGKSVTGFPFYMANSMIFKLVKENNKNVLYVSTPSMTITMEGQTVTLPDSYAKVVIDYKSDTENAVTVYSWSVVNNEIIQPTYLHLTSNKELICSYKSIGSNDNGQTFYTSYYNLHLTKESVGYELVTYVDATKSQEAYDIIMALMPSATEKTTIHGMTSADYTISESELGTKYATINAKHQDFFDWLDETYPTTAQE